MPLFAESEVATLQSLDHKLRENVPEVVQEKPEFFTEVLPAAFRIDNTVGSILSMDDLTPSTPDPNFLLTPENTAGFEDHVEKLAQANNPLDLEAIKSAINRERKDRDILMQAGGEAFLASLAAGILDPINLIPVGGMVARSFQLGRGVFRAAKAAGIAGAGAAVVAESVLQSTQEERTALESTLAVAGSAILAGLLGAGVSAVATSLERKAYKRALAELTGEVPFLGSDKIEVGAKDLIADGIQPAVKDKGPVIGDDILPLSDKGIGAGTRLGFIAKMKNAVGAITVAKALKLNPLIRVITSPALSTRQLAFLSSEVPFRFVDNSLGVATPHAAETFIKQWDFPIARLKVGTKDSYGKYRLEASQQRTQLKQSGLLPKDARALTIQEFRVRIGKAMRRDDKDDIAQVAEMAKRYRAELFDLVKEGMIKVGLLPTDVNVNTAVSYLTRVYNIPKVMGDKLRWRSTLQPWLRGTVKGRIKELEGKANKKGPNKFQDEINILKGYERADYDLIADDIADRLASSPTGRSRYEAIPIVFPRTRGSTAPRTLLISDKAIEEFLISDIDTVADTFARTAIPDLELARAFDGHPGAENFLGKEGSTEGGLIRDEYNRLIAAAKSPKEAIRLSEQKEADLGDASALIVRLRHQQGSSQGHSLGVHRASRILRQFNLITKLGSVVLSSIPDIARPVMVLGLRRAFAQPFQRLALRLSGNLDKIGAAVEEVQRAGTSLDMVLNTRANHLADIGDDFGRARVSGFERGLDKLSGNFGHISLLNPWNRAMKDWAGIGLYDTILKNVTDLKAGKLSPRKADFMRSLGLSDDNMTRIATQFEKSGETASGLRIPNTERWTDFEIVRSVRAAVAKGVDMMIVTPGVGDRPLLADNIYGGLILQFRSFAFAAVNRILISGLQSADMAVLNGAIMTVGMGALSFLVKERLAGREMTQDPGRIIAEGIDRGGLLGILSDANLVLERATRGTVGISPFLTGGQPLVRGIERRIGEGVLGPSVGTLEDIAKLTGSIAVGIKEGDPSQVKFSDVKSLIPYSNLFYLRALAGMVTDATPEGSGLHSFSESIRK